MRKIKDPSLFQSIRKFLTEDMPVVRKKSANTVEAYRYTLNLFLTFLGEKHNKLLSAVTAKDFCQGNVLGFMDWLLDERGNKATTVNLRLRHITGAKIQQCGDEGSHRSQPAAKCSWVPWG